MKWHSPAGHAVEVVRLSLTCRYGKHGGPADDGEQFLVRAPGGRVAECLARVRELVPDYVLGAAASAWRTQGDDAAEVAGVAVGKGGALGLDEG